MAHRLLRAMGVVSLDQKATDNYNRANMFDALTDKLNGVFRDQRGRITETNVECVERDA